MGADPFECTAAGETAQEAFGSAVKTAQYDYGHAGYTGSIAEKGEFTMITEEKMSHGAALTLSAELIEQEDPRVDDKWGPAGCIPLDNGEFLFFGWASS